MFSAYGFLNLVEAHSCALMKMSIREWTHKSGNYPDEEVFIKKRCFLKDVFKKSFFLFSTTSISTYLFQIFQTNDTNSVVKNAVILNLEEKKQKKPKNQAINQE